MLRLLSLIVFLGLCGCALLDEPRYEPPPGVPVSIEQVPPEVMDAFRARYPDAVEPLRVERCGSVYRFVLPDGGERSFNANGEVHGGVI
jgi:hypothetical protein